jgi:phosphopantothenoylcysteine decarboxylase/phosphopantothenate--cysteine ligase
MSSLQGKKILLGISGSIAAYKSAFIARLLVKAGAEVQVVMTPTATDFITPLTLSTLSKRPVFWNVASDDAWNNHVELGLWADAFLIAPLTATSLSKLATGLADNMLVATYLSARCPVFFAPAMDLDMWDHASTQENVATLTRRGDTLIPVEHGELASGLVGKGRMAEPEHILGFLEDHFQAEEQLKGVKALVTAGPTYEPIDPVRFIGNHSSGKMGVEIAKALARRGADVDLVLGPSNLVIEHPQINVHSVRTAQEMFEASVRIYPNASVGVMAAAVADYRPKTVATEKMKKKEAELLIELEKTPDIAKELGATKRKDQLLIGFALETENEHANAKGKLERKNLDFIVLNSLNVPGAGFHHDTNQVTIIHRDNKEEQFELKSKKKVAEDIVATIVQYIYLKESGLGKTTFQHS